MRARSRTPVSKRGFTGIEVIAVLVVLGILAATFVAGMDVHASAAVAADVLRSHLGYAQSLAMANNTADWGVAFSGASYTLLRDGNPAPVFWPNESSATYSLPAGISILSGLGPVDLNEWGAPETTHVVMLSDGTQTRSVSITGFTGLVP